MQGNIKKGLLLEMKYLEVNVEQVCLRSRKKAEAWGKLSQLNSREWENSRCEGGKLSLEWQQGVGKPFS